MTCSVRVSVHCWLDLLLSSQGKCPQTMSHLGTKCSMPVEDISYSNPTFLFGFPKSQGLLIIQDPFILRILTVVRKSKCKGYSGIQGMDDIKENRCLGDYNGTKFIPNQNEQAWMERKSGINIRLKLISENSTSLGLRLVGMIHRAWACLSCGFTDASPEH